MKKYLISNKITHRQIPFHIGLTFEELEKNIQNNGDIENSKYHPDYIFENNISNPEWQFKDEK